MSLKISRILHAGYVFECDQVQIAFDPIFENPFSRNCYAFPPVQFDQQQIKNLQFSAIFISHFHDDHCSLESLNLLDRKTPIYMYCLHEEIFSMLKELGFFKVFSLQIDSAVNVGPFEITSRRALDADVDSLFQIKAAGLNILNVVDSWVDFPTMDLLKKNKPWDMILWPFQSMREIEVLSPSRHLGEPAEIPPELMAQIKELNPKYIVPSSCQFQQEDWSWYNQFLFPISYKKFQQEIEKILPLSHVVRLNPGKSVVLDKSSIQASENLSWIVPVGEQDVDYDYQPNLQAPATCEVAKKIAALTAEQTQFVYDYCEKGLLERYKKLNEPAGTDERDDLAEPIGGYFNKPRIWQLSVFDHLGEEKKFYYKLNRGQFELTKDTVARAWLTEVPIAKLYAALTSGESLTSMYIRINDTTFDHSIEKEIQSADTLEDPLVRCLFTGVFGSYQAAQLQKLKRS